MSSGVEIDIELLVKDTLIGTYVMAFGATPDQGSFTPDSTTLAVLQQMFGKDFAKIRQYCSDAMLAHLWVIRKEKSPTPFYVNTRLVSPNMIEYVSNHRAFLRKRYGSLLSDPDIYFNTVYSQVYESELDYLNIAAECAFRDMEMNWGILSPSLYWYLIVVTGVKDMPCERLSADDVPERWKTTKIDYKGSRVTLDSVVGKERNDLKEGQVRMKFIQAAEKAIYDATFQWSVRYRLIRTYLNGDNKPAIAKDFSQLKLDDLMIHYPLADRDKQFFETAKEALIEKGFEIKPLPPSEERNLKEVDRDETAGKRDTGVQIRGNRSLGNAIAAASKEIDA